MTEKKADGEIVKRIDFISEYIRSMVADIKENDDATNSVELCVVSLSASPKAYAYTLRHPILTKSEVRCDAHSMLSVEVPSEIITSVGVL